MKNFTSGIVLVLMAIFSANLLHAQPELEWVRSLGGEDGAGGTGISVDSDDNVYSTGYFIGETDFSTSGDPVILERNLVTAYVTKHSPDGELIWVRSLSGSGGNGGLAITVDDHIYVSGYFSNILEVTANDELLTFEAVGFDMFILKMNFEGDIIWAKSIGGTSEYDWAQTIKTDPNDGSVYVGGNFSGTVDFDPGDGVFELVTEFAFEYDGFILKLTPDGNFEWVYRIGGPGYEVVQNIAIDPAGFVYAAGIFEVTAEFDFEGSGNLMTSANFADGFVLKIGTDKSFQWAVQIGDENQDWANGIAVDPFGDVVVTGMFHGTMDFDPGSGTEWMTSDGWDVFVWKLSGDGELRWARQLGGPSFAWGNAIALDDQGNVYTTGWFNGLGDFDPGEEYYFFNGIAYYEMFISKLDVNGDFDWAVQVVGDPGSYDNQGMSIVVDGDNNVFTTGYYSLTANFDPNDPDFSISATGISENGFVYKLSQMESVGTDNNIFANNLNVFPNPTSNEITVDLGEKLNSGEIRIFDISGRLILSQNVQQTDLIKIQLPSSAVPGMYFVEVTNEAGANASFKIIRQ